MAVAGIYIILAAIFGSYSRPVVVMSIIPFGIVGAIVGHYLMGFNLTILSMIGLLGLAGILVNNSIILVARLKSACREVRIWMRQQSVPVAIACAPFC